MKVKQKIFILFMMMSLTSMGSITQKIILKKVKFEDVQVQFALKWLQGQYKDATGKHFNILYKKTSKDWSHKIVTLNLENIEFEDAIKAVCLKALLFFQYDNNILIITDRKPEYILKTQFYKVAAHFSGSAGRSNEEIKFFLKDMGITFGKKTKVNFLAGVGKLVMTNTAENHRKLKKAFIELGFLK